MTDICPRCNEPGAYGCGCTTHELSEWQGEEIERLRAGLERLQLPLAFHVAGRADPEHRARMFYAHAILNGSTAEEAEDIAKENVRRATADRLSPKEADHD
tara:strand:+ start:198 stop:500 length:303 start_codon:yes stop_codon:yes gene_type:complete